tara:strand:+ start:3409 stop:3936 length:528 start_codon:yes stop_codon:yes gene_type:complete
MYLFPLNVIVMLYIVIRWGFGPLNNAVKRHHINEQVLNSSRIIKIPAWKIIRNNQWIKKQHDSLVRASDITTFKVDNDGDYYDWDGLRNKFLTEGYDPKKYGHPVFFPDLSLYDGTHRCALLRFMYGMDYEIEVKEFVPKLTKKEKWLTFLVMVAHLPLYYYSWVFLSYIWVVIM